MTRTRRIVLALVALLAFLGAAVIGGYLYERPLLRTGTGYAAHNACAVTAVAGRTDPATDLPPNPLVPYLRTTVTPTAPAAGGSTGTGSSAGTGSTGTGGTRHTASTTILGLAARQDATFTPGYGCTLGDPPADLPAPTAVDAAANPLTAQPTPTPGPALTKALAAAFGDDLDAARQGALGTRGVVVVHDGRVVAERYADGFTAATPQLGWSMSKSVTNLLVGRLVLAGKVALTDDHLRPEWDAAGDGRSAITIDQLLRMTSGLTWDETYALGTPITQMLYGERDMGAYAASQPLAHPPGTVEQYSSGSTTLLCSVLVERAGGGADLPRREVFAPLGLASAVLEPDGVGTPVCSSYLWATPRDWAALGELARLDGVWGGKRLLPAGWIAESTKALGTPGEDANYGASWWVNRTATGTLAQPTLPADAFWMQGHDGQRVVVVPSAKLVVVRLGFTPDTTVDNRMDALVRDVVAAVDPPAAE